MYKPHITYPAYKPKRRSSLSGLAEIGGGDSELRAGRLMAGGNESWPPIFQYDRFSNRVVVFRDGVSSFWVVGGV